MATCARCKGASEMGQPFSVYTPKSKLVKLCRTCYFEATYKCLECQDDYLYPDELGVCPNCVEEHKATLRYHAIMRSMGE